MAIIRKTRSGELFVSYYEDTVILGDAMGQESIDISNDEVNEVVKYLLLAKYRGKHFIWLRYLIERRK